MVLLGMTGQVTIKAANLMLPVQYTQMENIPACLTHWVDGRCAAFERCMTCYVRHWDALVQKCGGDESYMVDSCYSFVELRKAKRTHYSTCMTEAIMNWCSFTHELAIEAYDL